MPLNHLCPSGNKPALSSLGRGFIPRPICKLSDLGFQVSSIRRAETGNLSSEPASFFQGHNNREKWFERCSAIFGGKLMQPNNRVETRRSPQPPSCAPHSGLVGGCFLRDRWGPGHE